MELFNAIIFSWFGNYNFSEIWIYVYDFFTGFIFWSYEPSLWIWFWLFIPVMLFWYFLILFWIWRWIKKIFTIKNFSFWNNPKYFSWLFLIIPILIIFYPIILWLSDTKLQWHKKHIWIWIFICLFFVIYYWAIRSAGYTNWIGLLYFLPVILLIFLICNPQKLFLKIWKYLWIIIIIFILLTQPFYRQLFYDRTDPENQKICYSRPIEDINRWPCFKIFKWIRID